MIARKLSLAFALTASCWMQSVAGDIAFNRDVRPILSENCFQCHGPDKAKRKAKMRLDERESAIEKLAIVPGKPGESKLLQRLLSTDPEGQMPPPDTHKKLSAVQVETLKKWIAEGAEYQAHWAYLKPVRPPVPKVKSPKWARNPIDAFVLQKLESQGLTPSPEADARTLARRAALDILGLPPTPAEVEAVAKGRSKAYEALVDRCLQSPHYGERMAVPWLDAVRYADTVGYHGDQNQNSFPYRDWVIDAFNRNLPFDQFTIDQLAGDLLPNPTTAQRTATCFNRLNMVTREGGAQPGEYLAKYAADRVRTVSGAWLGSTMACAECHDHKYDPFSTKDFYQMAAFFADMRQWGVYMDYAYTPNPDFRGFSNDHPFPPEMEVESPYLRQRIQKLSWKVDSILEEAATQESKSLAAELKQWSKEIAAFLKSNPTGWQELRPVSISESYEQSADGGLHFTTNKAENLAIEFKAPSTWVSAVQLEIPAGSDSAFRTSDKRARLKLAASLKKSGETNETLINFRNAGATTYEPRFVNGFDLTDTLDGWTIDGGKAAKGVSGVWLLSQPVKLQPGDRLSLKLEGNKLKAARFLVTPISIRDVFSPIIEPSRLTALRFAKPSARATKMEWIAGTDVSPATHKQLQSIEQQIASCRHGKAKVLVTESVAPVQMRVLSRGNWQDTSGEVVQPGVPHFLPQPTAEGRQTRLDLARWIVSPENPLTSRVFVNRLWKQLFGAGLSAQVDDLGAQGEAPVHPELLDWLAVEFQESGWDIKHMLRLIVTSATYRQESSQRQDLRETDPTNRLLASQNARRLDAEFVRDNALAIAGILNRDFGGPSVHPYQPKNYYESIQFPSRDYEADTDDRQYRRGLYTHWQRTFLHPMLANFDAPSREECTVVRTLANTPQQALTLLNDPSFVEASKAFAEKLLSEKPANDKVIVQRAFLRALSRQPTIEERDSLIEFLANQRRSFKQSPEKAAAFLKTGLSQTIPSDPVELAAWTSVTRVILNLHETITRY